MGIVRTHPIRRQPLGRGLRAVLLVLFALVLAGPLRADFVNGDFETGDFTGWTLEAALFPGCILGDFGPLPPGHPAPAVVSASSPLLPGQVLAVAPYGGRYMARINDTEGEYHVTRLSQAAPLTAADLALGSLALTWGAMLVEPPGHEPECMPFVLVEVEADGVVVDSFAANASVVADPGSGWVESGDALGTMWYGTGEFCVDLRDEPVGTTIEVSLTVGDCGQGGHGAFAYLDDVRYRTACCVPPPLGLVGWWPLDETPAPSSVARDLAFGQDGAFVGPLAAIAGCVAGALDFDGLSTRVRVLDPTDGSLDIGPSGLPPGNGDFSIDAWVRPEALAGIQPIASKTGCWTVPTDWAAPQTECPKAGYSFFVHDDRLGLAMLDGGFVPFVFLSEPLPALGDGQWHLAAVTVDRDSATGVRFLLDGVPVLALASDPTPCSGSLANNGPFLIGNESILQPGWFLGGIDEVEFFQRALDILEVESIFLSGPRGKCKDEWAILPPKSWFCGTATAVPALLQVGNGSDEDHTYSFWTQPMPAGGILGTGGPLVSSSSASLDVGALSVAYESLTLHKPPGLTTPGMLAAYKVHVTNLETGRTFGDTAKVSYSASPCWSLVWPIAQTAPQPAPAPGPGPGPGPVAPGPVLPAPPGGGPATHLDTGLSSGSNASDGGDDPSRDALVLDVRTSDQRLVLHVHGAGPFAPVTLLLEVGLAASPSVVLAHALAADARGEALLALDLPLLVSLGAEAVAVHARSQGGAAQASGGLTLLLPE